MSLDDRVKEGTIMKYGQWFLRLFSRKRVAKWEYLLFPTIVMLPFMQILFKWVPWQQAVFLSEQSRRKHFEKTEKIAVITAIFGDFEKTVKPAVKQNVPCDFIVFSDHPVKTVSPWELDTVPYYMFRQFRADYDMGNWTNSYERHKHPHNAAKYFKQQFFRIPRMQNYTTVIWIDSSFDIVSPSFVTNLLWELGSEQHTVVAYEHPFRYDIVSETDYLSRDDRWKSTTLRGKPQPFQNLSRQLDFYLNEAKFPVHYFRTRNIGYGHYGLWTSGLTAWNMSRMVTRELLDTWFIQNLNFTTQDQIGFVYALWKHDIWPGVMPLDVYTNGFVTYKRHGK